MLGKTAAGLFWMFRFLERGENGARLLEAGFRIALTRSATASAEWKSILATSGALGEYESRDLDYDSAHVINFLLRDETNPASVICNIKAARDNARLVRTALTREVWEATNEAWITLQSLLARQVKERDLPDVLGVIRQQMAVVRGAMAGTMLRNDGYNFARLGMFLERADNTARILDVKYYLLLPSFAQIGSSLDQVHWETILRSVSARRAYRWLNGTDSSPMKVAEFLILHPQMPRSLSFCSHKIMNNLGYLEREYGAENESCRMAKTYFQKLQESNIEDVFENGLHEFVGEFLIENGALAMQIEHDYRFRG
ncbi:MAG: alpha-E domain-containing protein [Lysobacterales bacterium]